jgi:hypothetical protein
LAWQENNRGVFVGENSAAFLGLGNFCGRISQGAHRGLPLLLAFFLSDIQRVESAFIGGDQRFDILWFLAFVLRPTKFVSMGILCVSALLR